MAFSRHFVSDEWKISGLVELLVASKLLPVYLEWSLTFSALRYYRAIAVITAIPHSSRRETWLYRMECVARAVAAEDTQRLWIVSDAPLRPVPLVVWNAFMSRHSHTWSLFSYTPGVASYQWPRFNPLQTNDADVNHPRDDSDGFWKLTVNCSLTSSVFYFSLGWIDHICNWLLN